jgi:uncharacterized protein (TIGR00295 family)
MVNESNKYPTRDECLKILREHGCTEKVIVHILTVTDLAMKIAGRFPDVDLSLLEAGSLLHDLGRSRSHGIDHAVQGAKLAAGLGLPTELVNIIERHIVAGIPKEAAIELGLPAKDYTPQTLEERIVAHADNLVEDNRRCPITRSVEILKQKGLPEVAQRILELHKTLSDEAGIDLDEL